MKILVKHPIYADNTRVFQDTKNKHGGREPTITGYLESLFDFNESNELHSAIKQNLWDLLRKHIPKIIMHHIDDARDNNKSDNILLTTAGTHTLIHSNGFYKSLLYYFNVTIPRNPIGQQAFQYEQQLNRKFFNLPEYKIYKITQLDDVILDCVNKQNPSLISSNRILNVLMKADIQNFINSMSESYLELDAGTTLTDKCKYVTTKFLYSQLQNQNDKNLIVGLNYLLDILKEL